MSEREKKRGEQICLSVTDDDDDIGHWVKEIERLLCEAGAEVNQVERETEGGDCRTSDRPRPTHCRLDGR